MHDLLMALPTINALVALFKQVQSSGIYPLVAKYLPATAAFMSDLGAFLHGKDFSAVKAELLHLFSEVSGADAEIEKLFGGK